MSRLPTPEEIKEIRERNKERDAKFLGDPKLPEKINLLRKRWWELYQAERELRDFDRTKTGIHLTIRAVDHARAAVMDAVREFFYEEMGGGRA
jgi:hypothetical protein